MASCKNHATVSATVSCAGCQQSFCGDCVVDLKGQSYCGNCKNKQVRQVTSGASFTLPGEALKYSIVGIFCFGFILQPVAIFKAASALGQIKRNPALPGKGQAVAAMVIAIAWLCLFVLGITAQVLMAGSQG